MLPHLYANAHCLCSPGETAAGLNIVWQCHTAVTKLIGMIMNMICKKSYFWALPKSPPPPLQQILGLFPSLY